MYAFLCTDRPRSVNAKRTDKYQEQIRQAFRKYCRLADLLREPLYGIAYYFHAEHNQLDADNLSKPIWDALEGLAYQDDSVVQLRHSGIIDLRQTDLTVFDLSQMPDNVANAMVDFVATEEKHIIYVEFGSLKPEMFVFGCSE